MEKVKLRDVLLRLESGGRPKGGATDFGIFSVGAEHLAKDGGFDFSRPKYIPISFYNRLKNGLIEIDDILIVKDGATTGKISYVNDDFPLPKAAINEHVFKLKVDKCKIFSKYAFYFLYSSNGNRQILSDFRGATVGGISKEILDKVEIPLPPLAEQKAIVAKLDKADEIKRLNQKLIEKYDALTQSLFIDMFGDPVQNEREWCKEKLEYFAKREKNSIVDGPFGSSIKETDYIDVGIPIIRINNIRNDKFYDKEYKFLSEKKYLELIRSKIDFEDIIMARVGNTIGKSCIFDKKFKALLSTTGVCKISVDQDKFNLIFIAKQLSFKTYKNYIISNVQGAGQPYLNLSKIKNFQLINPPIELQNQFAERVKAIEAQKKLAQDALTKSETLFNSLLQASFG